MTNSLSPADAPSPRADRALVVVGSRRLNKRACLFFEGFRREGFVTCALSLPRGAWSWKRFEDESLVLEAGRLFVHAPNQPAGFRADVIACLHWAMLPLCIVLKWMNGARLIYDEHDFYELNTLEGEGTSWRRKLYSACVAIMHRFCLRHVDQITCIRMAKGVLKHRLQRRNRQVVELHNYPTKLWSVSATHRPRENTVCFVFVGGIWEVKGCRTVAQAFARLREASQANTELHFFGTGDHELARWLADQPGIEVHDESTPSTLRSFMRDRLCVGMMLYEDGPRYRILGTNSRKMFEYLACGAAIVATRLGEVRAFLREHDVGYGVEPNASIAEMTQVFARIVENPDELRRKCATASELMTRPEMTWEAQWDKVRVTADSPRRAA